MARVEVILDAAGKAAVEFGTDDVGSTDIAHVAGVPIGSVYQYFPDKHSIYFGASSRYLGMVVDLAAKRLSEHAPKRWQDVVTTWVTAQADTMRTHGGMRVIWSGIHAKGMCVSRYRLSNAEVGALIRSMIAVSFPDQAAALDDHSLSMGIDAAEAMLSSAFRADKQGEAHALVLASSHMVEILKASIGR